MPRGCSQEGRSPPRVFRSTDLRIMNNVLDVALDYIRRGWNPVPIPFKKKTPLDRDWQNRIIDESTAPRFFNGGTQNIGIQLRSHSRSALCETSTRDDPRGS